MKITQAILDDLTAKAQASPRLRMNMDLRNSSADGSQRMLNALEPGTPLPIHRHTKSSETVVCLRGRLVEEFYDEGGRCIEEIELRPNGPVVALNIPIGQWHTVRVLESGTVIMEVKEEIRLFQRRPEVKCVKEFWYMEVPSCTEWKINTPSHRPVFPLPIPHARRRQQAPCRAAGV